MPRNQRRELPVTLLQSIFTIYSFEELKSRFFVVGPVLKSDDLTWVRVSEPEAAVETVVPRAIK